MAQVIQTVDQVLSNAAQIIIQSTGSGSCQIVRATVANYDTVSHNVTFWRVPPGASVSNGTLMVPNCSVLAGQTVSPPINGQALVGGASLQALVDTGNAVVNLNVTYGIIAVS